MEYQASVEYTGVNFSTPANIVDWTAYKVKGVKKMKSQGDRKEEKRGTMSKAVSYTKTQKERDRHAKNE